MATGAKTKRKRPERAGDLKPAPYNPRQIDEDALGALGRSMDEFGDIAGLTFNVRTGHLVAGHQRLRKIPPAARIADYRAASDGNGTVGYGTIRHNGSAWRIRFVDWLASREKAANVAANSPLLAGTFSGDLDAVLGEINLDLPDLAEALRLNELGTPIFDPVGEDEQGRLDEKAKVTCPECGHEFTP